MTDIRPPERRKLRIGFRASIVTLFVAVVLFVGLTLVYLSFSRVSAITQTAASSFIDKVAQLGADRIDSKFRNVRDSLEILAGLPSIQSAEIEDNARLYGLMASMLRNNPQLFNLYVGYDDGSFLEMDVIDRARPEFRASLGVGEDAAFRLVIISRTGGVASPVTVTTARPEPAATAVPSYSMLCRSAGAGAGLGAAVLATVVPAVAPAAHALSSERTSADGISSETDDNAGPPVQPARPQAMSRILAAGAPPRTAAL